MAGADGSAHTPAPPQTHARTRREPRRAGGLAARTFTVYGSEFARVSPGSEALMFAQLGGLCGAELWLERAELLHGDVHYTNSLHELLNITSREHAV